MSQNNDINNHAIKGRLKDRFNDRAFSEDIDLSHDKAMDKLEENNINTGLLMGQGGYIGRKDQFHFHEDKKKQNSPENEEKRTKKFFDRLFLLTYLEQINETLKAIDRDIAKIRKRIEDAHNRLAENQAQFDQNEHKLDLIDRYMKGQIPKKNKGEDFADDDLTRWMILLGHNPEDLTDAQVRQILDKEGHKLLIEQGILSQSIQSDTISIDIDNKRLEEKEAQRDQLLRIKNKVIDISKEEGLTDEEKQYQVQALIKEEDLDADKLDKIRDSVEDDMEQEASNLLNQSVSEAKKSERHENNQVDEKSSALFAPKP